MKRKIAIIGGSYLQLPLVQKAQEMGLEVHCFAWEEGAVCKDVADFFYPISIVEKALILDKCREIGINGITSIASDLAVLTVNYVAGQMGLVGNDDQYSFVQTNKYLMRQCFDRNGLPSPRFYLVQGEGALPTFEKWHWPLIVKPTDRSGSRAVCRVTDKNQLVRAVHDAMDASFAKEAIVEEFVTGKEVSVEAISWKGKHFILQITDKVTTDEHFVEIAHHQPSLLPERVQKRIRAVVENALTALHIENGASHSELKITSSGDLKIMEIGARMGGGFIGSHLVPLSTGYDYMRGVIEIALGSFTEPVLNSGAYSGIFFLVEDTAYLAEIIKHPEYYPDIVIAERTSDSILPAISESDRTGYLIYKSNHRIDDIRYDRL